MNVSSLIIIKVISSISQDFKLVLTLCISCKIYICIWTDTHNQSM